MLRSNILSKSKLFISGNKTEILRLPYNSNIPKRNTYRKSIGDVIEGSSHNHKLNKLEKIVGYSSASLAFVILSKTCFGSNIYEYCQLLPLYISVSVLFGIMMSHFGFLIFSVCLLSMPAYYIYREINRNLQTKN